MMNSKKARSFILRPISPLQWLCIPFFAVYECGTKYLKNEEQIRIIKNCNMMQAIYLFMTLLSLKFQVVDFSALLYTNLAMILGYFGFTLIGLHKIARIFLTITSIITTTLFIMMDGMKNFFWGYYLLIIANSQFFFTTRERSLKNLLCLASMIISIFMIIFLDYQNEFFIPSQQVLKEFATVFFFSQMILIFHNRKLNQNQARL